MKHVGRRRFLRGVGGALLALPLLSTLGRSARAQPFPKRLVIVFTANGTVQSAWAPTWVGQDFTLTGILEPLAPHKSDLLVLQGLDVESSYHGPGDQSHMCAMGHMLTATELIELGGSSFTGGGISVDQRIAQEVGATTKLASLELCVEEHPATISTRMSYLGPAQPVPPEPNPEKAFKRLFGGDTPELIAKRKSVLDFVSEDYADLARRISTEDRQKVAAHLDAVREIEKRLDVTPKPSCGPVALASPDDPSAPEAYPTVGKLQMDLLVAALACDLTRVASLQWSKAASDTHMSWLGIAESHHDISHQPQNEPSVIAKLTTINRWYAEQVAYLLSAMKAVPEGDGTLLDHSVVLWCNELGDGQLHERRQVPYVLAGSCGGYFKTGNYLLYGGAPSGEVHGRLLVSLCQAMGLDVETFGDPQYGKGPLPRLTG